MNCCAIHRSTIIGRKIPDSATVIGIWNVIVVERLPTAVEIDLPTLCGYGRAIGLHGRRWQVEAIACTNGRNVVKINGNRWLVGHSHRGHGAISRITTVGRKIADAATII